MSEKFYIALKSVLVRGIVIDENIAALCRMKLEEGNIL